MTAGQQVVRRQRRFSLPAGWTSSTVIVFGGAVLVMLGAWMALAVLYSGLGGEGSVLEARRVLEAVSSSTASRGPVEVRAILATPEYFAIDGRGDEYFAIDPDRNIGVLSESPGFFDALDQGASALAVDPTRNLPVLVTINVHEGDIPDPGTWVGQLRLDAGAGPIAPLPGFRLVFNSEHHQSVAVQFPRDTSSGSVALEQLDGDLRLSVPDVEAGSGTLTVEWALPLDIADAPSGNGARTAAAFGSVLAVTAGLLVVFSPCAVHMTAYFLPLITGLGMREVLDHVDDVGFRARTASLGVAFVSGFVLLYTIFGGMAGVAGQFLGDTARLEAYLVPVRIVTGGIVVFMALQALGLFRLPFVVALRLPGRPADQTARRGYFAAMIAGMTISVGCLTCVGGSLLASLLLYAGASGSPATGALTLFLFSIGMSMPFLLAAFAYERALPVFARARSVLRYSTTVAGALMLVVGLLIMSGTDSIFEQLIT